MTVRSAIGNSVIAASGYVATKTTAIAMTQTKAADRVSELPVSETANQSLYLLQLTDPYVLVGFTVPNWLGVLFFFVALIFGTIVGMNQDTPVDKKFKRLYLKPVYSLSFGVMMSIFVVPAFYPQVTIWGLIVPAAFFSAIGSVVIYYVIAFFISERLWMVINTEAHSSAPDIIKAILGYLKTILMAFIGRSGK